MDMSGMNCRKRRKIRANCSAKADARQIAIQPKIIRHDLTPMPPFANGNSTDISMEGPFGSKADVTSLESDVCIAPESRHHRSSFILRVEYIPQAHDHLAVLRDRHINAGQVNFDRDGSAYVGGCSAGDEIH